MRISWGIESKAFDKSIKTAPTNFSCLVTFSNCQSSELKHGLCYRICDKQIWILKGKCSRNLWDFHEFIFWTTAIFTKICKCSSWKRARKGAHLKNCFGFIHGTIARFCKRKRGACPVRRGTWHKISDCGFAKCLDYQPWRVMGKPTIWLCTMLYESGLPK